LRAAAVVAPSRYFTIRRVTGGCRRGRCAAATSLATGASTMLAYSTCGNGARVDCRARCVNGSALEIGRNAPSGVYPTCENGVWTS
jgi:hypothetical protein